jgi:ribonuclease HI
MQEESRDSPGWVEKTKEGYTKLNVDASFYDQAFVGATGAVMRDDQGNFVAGSCCSIASISDAATVEACALRDGLLLAGQVGCTKLIVNGDCMDVIEIMQDGGINLVRLQQFMKNAIFFVEGFPMLFLNHCPRESNKVAHTLASKAVGSQSIVWLDDPPDFLIEILANDVTIFDDQ